MGVDVSVIVTAHNETLVSGPTMTAADVAIKDAEAAGFSVERIIALDNATPETIEYFSQPAFDAWQRRMMTCGDLGRVRNALVPDVAGAAIAFLDADDLFSANWLSQGLRRLRVAEAAGEKVIVHPELNWLFDGAHSVFWKPDQDDPLFLPEYLYFMNYYDSLCLVPREAHLAVPYVSRDIPRGLSFQDWQFSIESMAAGWKHVNAPETIIFKRRRDDSLVTESRARKALVRPLPPMRIDQIAKLSGPRKPMTVETPQSEDGRQIGARVGSLSTLVRRVLGRAPTPISDDYTLAEPGAEFAEADKPETPAQVPNYGKVFADRVALAKSGAGGEKRAWLAAMTEDYKTIAPAFDTAFYLARHQDIARSFRMDPVAHYLRAGAKEGRNPSPLFSTKAYLALYPDVAESGDNPFAHYLTKGQEEGRIAPPVPRFDRIAKALGVTAKLAERSFASRYRDLRSRLEFGELGRQANLAAEIEPLVSLGWPEALQVKIPPFHSDLVASRLGAFLDLLQAAGHRPARFVICVNRARFGGALRLEGQIAQALASGCPAEDILVVVTDKPGKLPEARLPKGVRQVDFADMVADLKEPQRERVLAEVIRALAPEAVFNVNSRTLWRTLSTYGDALASGTKIIGALFCPEQSIYGHWTGYPYKRFYRHFDHLHAVITDSQALTDELHAQYTIPEYLSPRIVTLQAPVNDKITLVPSKHGPSDRALVFWSGRFDRQKRVDLVLDIAAAMPDVDFHLWGEAVMDARPPEPKSDNVTLHAPYAQFADLPLSEADLWLYTSGWDGVPQTLLEVGMSGLPLIASEVGGTREAALPGLARLMPPEAEVKAWAAEIRSVLADLPAAQEKARTLRGELLQTRTREAYAKQVWAILEKAPAETPIPADVSEGD